MLVVGLGGTTWILTHGHMFNPSDAQPQSPRVLTKSAAAAAALRDRGFAAELRAEAGGTAPGAGPFRFGASLIGQTNKQGSGVDLACILHFTSDSM